MATRGAGWSGRRLVLTVLGGMLALLCLGGAGIGYLLYDKATEPNRSAPNAAADNYLRALLVERNSVRVDLFTCRDPDLGAIGAFAGDIGRREQELGERITVNLEDMRVDAHDGETASVSVAIRRTATVDGVRQSIVDRWDIQLRKEDGWRVCGATPQK